jgi:thiamine biosynthesis lipoprotein
MGTQVVLTAYTTERLDEAATHAVLQAAFKELVRLSDLLSEWRPESEISRVNAHAGQRVAIGDDTLHVLDKSIWAGQVSGGTFDISFAPLFELWRFGDAADANPTIPTAREVRDRRSRVDFRRIELDRAARSVRIEPGMKLGLGGIAKGYIVDRVVEHLRRSGLSSFLVRAGGDLYGGGRKPDGSAWVSAIQDPRGADGKFFATLELTDRAFSTAGDYARAYVVGGRRYHHIIDPRTGYPARGCRSVTVAAGDALLADALDDAVFILGPERGLELIERIDGAGAVIVDANNRVVVSRRLAREVRVLSQPTDGI